jgi:hypothetical protein
MEEGKLWATHIRYLNDASEFRVLSDTFFDHASDAVDKRRDASLMNEWSRRIRRPEIYTASFSAVKTGDDLSQWRAYGGQHTGVSLGFRPQYLRDVCRHFLKGNQGWIGADKDSLIECAYYKQKQFPEVDPEILANIKRNLATGDRSEQIISLALYGASLKHEGFRAESEWRIALVRENGFPFTDLKFRQLKSLIAPYVPIPLKLDGCPIQILRVVVGPAPHMDEAVDAVKFLLAKNNVPVSEVVPSKIPYRNW